jgi:hypothetical protein
MNASLSIIELAIGCCYYTCLVDALQANKSHRVKSGYLVTPLCQNFILVLIVVIIIFEQGSELVLERPGLNQGTG